MFKTAMIGGLAACALWPGVLRADDAAARDDEAIDGRLTWVQWWDINRDTHLRKALKAGPATRPDAGRDAATERAVAALLEATRGPSADLRAEAALALARIGEGLDRLVEMTEDKESRVRCRAWVGLGLLGREKELLGPAKLDAAETLAFVTGLGLLDHPGRPALDRLRTEARVAESTEVRRMAVWALRVYHARRRVDATDDRALLLALLRETRSVPLAIEVITAMGVVGGRENIDALADIADLGRATQALPVFAAAGRNPAALFRAGGNDVHKLRAAACTALAQLDAGHSTGLNSGPLTTVLALNAIRPPERTTSGQIVVASQRPLGDLYPAMSVLALGRFGVHDTATALLTLDLPTTPVATHKSLGIKYRGWDGQDHLIVSKGATHAQQRDDLLERAYVRERYGRSPQRAFAAIALGLAQNANAAGELRTRAAVNNEPRHLRAACALALGLGNGNAGLLAQLADGLSPATDPLLCGYTLLALGLQQSDRTLEFASRFSGPGAAAIDPAKVLASDFDQRITFDPPANVPPVSRMDAVLGARAGLLGMALTRDPRAGPALLAAWGHDPWTSLEAARAMNWCGVYDGVDPMIELVRQAEKPNAAAWSARCLGELLDPDAPSRLGRLVEGNCFARPIPGPPARIAPQQDGAAVEPEFHALGNPFAYDRLLPRTADRRRPPRR